MAIGCARTASSLLRSWIQPHQPVVGNRQVLEESEQAEGHRQHAVADLEGSTPAVDHAADDLVQREAGRKRIPFLRFAEVRDVRSAQAPGFDRDDHFAVCRGAPVNVNQLDAAASGDLARPHCPVCVTIIGKGNHENAKARTPVFTAARRCAHRRRSSRPNRRPTIQTSRTIPTNWTSPTRLRMNSHSGR